MISKKCLIVGKMPLDNQESSKMQSHIGSIILSRLKKENIWRKILEGKYQMLRIWCKFTAGLKYLLLFLCFPKLLFKVYVTS
jgi:hypothetical protein